MMKGMIFNDGKKTMLHGMKNLGPILTPWRSGPLEAMPTLPPRVCMAGQ